MKLAMLTAAALAALTACSPAATNNTTQQPARAAELITKLERRGCEPVKIREPEIPDMAGCLFREGTDGQPATVVVMTREQTAMLTGEPEREAADRTGSVIIQGNGWAMLATKNTPGVDEIAETLNQ